LDLISSNVETCSVIFLSVFCLPFISEINSSKIIEMIEDKTITEGMIPKINTCLDAVKNDVTAVGIIDGRKPRSVLFELFSDKGSGTLIRK